MSVSPQVIGLITILILLVIVLLVLVQHASELNKQLEDKSEELNRVKRLTRNNR